MQRIFSLLVCTLLFCESIIAQTATGSWYGRADVMIGGNSNNYMTEMVLKQKGNDVEGIFGYYFKDSYQSFFVHGKYDPKTRLVHIKNMPMLYFRSETRNGIECPMHFMGTLMVSKAGNSMQGNFYTDDKYKYTCPELRVAYRMDHSEDNTDSLLRHAVAQQKFWKPYDEDYVFSAVAPKRVDSMAAVSAEAAKAPVVKEEIKEKEVLVEKFSKRKNSYSKEISIVSDSIRLSFYDNGDIDGDSISVFLNGQPIVANQLLSPRALKVYIALDPTKEINEISMFANNLGKLPPNTALMVIADGDNRHELYLSSSLTSNAAVRLRKRK
jgi:general stress protein 26